MNDRIEWTRGGGRSRWWLAAGLCLGIAGACADPEPADFCQRDDECVLGEVPGLCSPIDLVCVYPTNDCATGWTTASGRCAIGPNESGGGTSMDDSAVPSPMNDDGPEDTGGPATDDSADSAPTTDDASTDDASTDDGPPGDPHACGAGSVGDITSQGTAAASSEFSEEFPASLSIDGDLSTSWFSAGPVDGQPSLYEWTLPEARCITEINLRGNGLHANPDFRVDFGFEIVTVQVHDDAGMVVFEDTFDLSGSPDPDVSLGPNVSGTVVVVEFEGYESDVCGGFSELEIRGN